MAGWRTFVQAPRAFTHSLAMNTDAVVAQNNREVSHLFEAAYLHNSFN